MLLIEAQLSEIAMILWVVIIHIVYFDDRRKDKKKK